MTRILCIGDSHFGVRSREAQCLAVHDWFADLALKTKPDLVLHSGDVFDAWSRPDDRMHVADWIARIADVCPVVIAKGGGVHDRKDDAAIMSRLRTKHPVIIEQAAGTHRLHALRPTRTHLGNVRENQPLIVAAMAWPEPAWLAASTGLAGEALDQVVRERLRDLLRGLGATIANHHPTVFVAHMLVDGSRVSNGQELVGAALNVGLADLALVGADAYVLGHIHLAQQWDIDGAPCFYTGSPFAKTWGETEEKSVALLEWTGDGFTVERIPTPSPRMIHLEAEWEDHIGLPGDVVVPAGLSDPLLHFHERVDVQNAEVRLRYRTPSDRRDEARRAAEQRRDEILEAGAASVKLEPVIIAESRARAPEVARATSIEAQLIAYWRSIGYAAGLDPEQRRGALLAKLAELEASNAA